MSGLSTWYWNKLIISHVSYSIGRANTLLCGNSLLENVQIDEDYFSGLKKRFSCCCRCVKKVWMQKILMTTWACTFTACIICDENVKEKINIKNNVKNRKWKIISFLLENHFFMSFLCWLYVGSEIIHTFE